ncbi:Predicted PurR-regulated permease PerM [Pustulibacterium marinum]|uniref:Predicted PurR-regulated permease PerM n=1 Tax=Pustulibacterium marinum TaxID=1224947 RepID=A0A1I7F8A5_9FLAO|nr:AI-2E family transporter [Pustulibacterium marinum]SFU32336.1 Predicted PurR-regulated permease PerM [Pustulibacterium marinum]
MTFKNITKKHAIHPNLIRQLFILSVIIFLGYLITKEMMPYLSGILGAITLYVLFNKWMHRMLKSGWKPWLAATTILITSISIIIIPLGAIAVVFVSKINDLFKNKEEITRVINETIQKIEDLVPFSVTSGFDTNKLTSWISNYFTNIANSTFNIFIAITLMLFLLYFMLINRNYMRGYIMMYIPLSDRNIRTLAKESREIVKSNAIGIPLVALIQGVIALIGYWIFGVPNPMLWFVVTFVGSMIPFVGTALGVIPVTLILLSQGHTFNGYGILIYGTVVVGSADNLFRMIVQNRLANLHPLITLIGVVIGVPLFGFIGLVFGPLVVSIFLLLLKMYKDEYGKSDQELQEENIKDETLIGPNREDEYTKL